MMTLREAFEFTFENKDEWIDGKAKSCQIINANHVLRLLDPEMDMEEITPIHFNELKKVLKTEEVGKGKTRSNAGINRILSALSTVLNFCYKQGIRKSGVSYSRLKEKEQKAKFFTEDEMDKLFNAAHLINGDSQLLYDSILFAYHTGDRQGELLTLEWSEVDLQDNTVTFLDTKNGEDHTIPLSKELLSMLHERYHHRTCERVFPWEGCKDGADALRAAFRKAKKIAGHAPEDLRLWHSLRHTTGRILLPKVYL